MAAMILHIVKKDWKLLWPIVALVAGVHVLTEWTRYRSGWFEADPPTPNPLELLEPAALVGWVALVVALAHSDRLPGSRQDWLVRPIRRADLVLAKIGFLVVLLHGPLFAAHTSLLIGYGFSIRESMGAAGTGGVEMFLTATLPVFAIATVTRNTMEFLIAGVIVALLVFFVPGLVFFLRGTNPDELRLACAPACGQAFDWLASVARSGIVLAGALAVIGWQYFTRNATLVARGVIGVVALCALVPTLLPTSLAFRAQQLLAAPAEALGNVEVAFDPAAPPVRAMPGDAQGAAEQRAIRAARLSLAGGEYYEAPPSSGDGARRAGIWVPLEISGLPADTILWADTIETRLVAAGGEVVHQSIGGELNVQAATGARVRARHVLELPADTIDAYAGQRLQLEVDYRLTVLAPESHWSLPAAGGVGPSSGGTQCAARVPAAGRTIVEFGCVTVKRPPSCYTVTLEQPAARGRNTGLRVCNPSYGPRGHGSSQAPVRRFGIAIPDATGAAGLEGAVIRYASYEARGHFAKRLVVPGFRLADWMPPASEPAPAR